MKGKRLLCLLALFFFQVGALHAVPFSARKTADKIRARIAELPEGKRARTRANLYSDLGTILYKTGYFKEAAEAFETALTYRTTPKLRRHIYRFMGKSYESSGHLDKSVAAYEKSAKHDKRNWKRHRDLAYAYERVSHFEKALKSYDTAIRRAPKESALFFSKAVVLRKMGFFSRANQSLAAAKDLGYAKPNFSQELSTVQEGQGRYQDALDTLRGFITASSPFSDWSRFTYLSVLNGDSHSAKEGLKMLKKKKASPSTISFHEAMVSLTNKSFADISSSRDTNSLVRGLFNSITNEK